MPSPAFLDRRSPVFAGRAMASSSSPLVTRVGLRVLEQGGNAADAAVAMAGMLALAEPMMSGLGGDTMAMVWSARDRNVFALNGSGRAPSGASLERIGPVPLMPEHGAASVTIPGAVDGWCTLLERFGTRSLEQLWEPVIGYAREGYPVGESIAGFWSLGAALLADNASAQLRELFLPGGRAPQPGQLMRLPQLAATLERVAREGRRGFYEGPVAEAIAHTVSAGGVPTTAADVAAQQQGAEWVEPLRVGYRGREVLGMPPNCQGVVALHALGILEGLPLASMDPAERLHHQIEAIRLGFELAIDVVGEPTPAMLEQLRQALSLQGLASARSRLTERARPATRPQGGNSGDTSYVCAVDPEGNAVSLMTSICGLFGSGLVAGDTGVLLNNRATQFSSRSGHPNALAPGHRPRHSILPAMVLREGLPEFVMGVIGGNAHPQGLTQILVNVLDLGLNPQQAVDAPRFKLIMQSGAVHIDPQFSPEVGHALVARGHQLGDSYGFVGFKGGAQMTRIHRDATGRCTSLEAGVDHRLDGVALGF
ncbi:MAG: gamma-glutamyltransferase family protein [Prochlorococcaceae cyanobacterium]|jgi:gamma-glutamyltranspeptidase/glutathione hydrolase